MAKTYLKPLFLVMVAASLLIGCAHEKPWTMFEPMDLGQKLQSGQAIQKATAFEIILDASSSMSQKYQEETKLNLAKDTVHRIMQTIPEMELTAALRTFGKGQSFWSTGTFLVYGPERYVPGAFEMALQTVRWAGGCNALADAVTAAGQDLASTEGDVALIIVSDGLEKDAAAVEAVNQLKASYGERLCVYSVLVGDDLEGEALLSDVAQASRCGSAVRFDDVAVSDDMAGFVETIFLGEPPDADGDGVYDYLDLCADTPEGVAVDESGCPLDADGDGVYDYQDTCPDTPEGVTVDESGCPLDTDKDGVYDYLDGCPDTPSAVSVDERGCPYDSDADGVFDYLDACPETRQGVRVSPTGCPEDSDGDGVYDYLDACPDTPDGIAVDDKGCPLDGDGDGVPNEMDACPGTRPGVVVDKIGCPPDQDMDGVFDYVDQCPDTPRGVTVDERGCGLDSDGDGVFDVLDACPGTRIGVSVDQNGCPPDSDGDGVANYMDECLDTAPGVIVDEKGCAKDSDGDGVYDMVDACPDTRKGVSVDQNGCPPDADNDGVPNYSDECANTPKGVTVDDKGCPEDSDGDGVFNVADACPDTRKGVRVDEKGCPKDADNDGVPDFLDQCPGTPAAAKVNDKGCWVIEGVLFKTGKWEIRPEAYPALDAVAEVLKQNPSMYVEIQGHTDNVGTEALNLNLSERRALAVRDYLVRQGIDDDRLPAAGYGYSWPVDSNDTPQGRAKNRRVQFRPLNADEIRP